MQSVGVVPAAGYARRLQPFSGSKEMIRVNGRPVVDFLLERLRLGGCAEIRVVTRPEKEDLVRHAAEQGATVVLARPASVSESLLAGIEGVADSDVVLFGFPDTIWEPSDGFARLLAQLAAPADLVLGLFRVDESADCDRVRLDETGMIRSVRVKPAVPDTDLTWGCFAARASALRALQQEPEPGLYFHSLRGSDQLAGVYLSDRYFDIGTPEALERASSGLWAWPRAGQGGETAERR
jgi:glucose-1-phosphate thymidylyltransferase